MSPREAPIKVVHLWAATALVLAGMGVMIWNGGRWQGEVTMQLQNMTGQVAGLRAELLMVAKQTQHDAKINAVQDEKIDRVLSDIEQQQRPRGRMFDR